MERYRCYERIQVYIYDQALHPYLNLSQTTPLKIATILGFCSPQLLDGTSKPIYRFIVPFPPISYLVHPTDCNNDVKAKLIVPLHVHFDIPWVQKYPLPHHLYITLYMMHHLSVASKGDLFFTTRYIFPTKPLLLPIIDIIIQFPSTLQNI